MLRWFLVVLLAALPPSAWAVSPVQRIVVFGDSLSAAYGLQAGTGWVDLLRTRLETQHPAYQVINASISGETTAGGLARMAEAISGNSPAVVILELGANDALRGLPLEAPRTNLSRIIEMCQESGARVLLVGTEIPVNYGPQYRDGLRTMYRDLAREFNVPLVPFLLEGVALDAALMQDDGLHPNAQAQSRVLENVWPALERMLKR
ncbi:MAG: arylesterase [Dokdonella sp.]|nr:MAG: arylesterase [Gammaproteobacteria bacterium]TXI72708.1 MAG: arylesterase [Dokdonella sp.]